MDHWVYENDRYYKWWNTILMECNHKESKIALGYTFHKIKRGQSAKSLRSWAHQFKTGTKQITKFFDLLEEDGMIKRETIGKGKQSTTLITIMNYGKYQDPENTQRSTKVPTRGKRDCPTNNNENNSTIKQRKREFKNELLPLVDSKISKVEAKEFFEYWTEHGSKDKKMRFEKEKSFGMFRRVSTWVKKAKEFKKEKSYGKKEKEFNDWN